MTPYKHFFGFQQEPFPQDIKVEYLYPLPGLKALSDRFLYALELGAINVITGEVSELKRRTAKNVSEVLMGRLPDSVVNQEVLGKTRASLSA